MLYMMVMSKTPKYALNRSFVNVSLLFFEFVGILIFLFFTILKGLDLSWFPIMVVVFLMILRIYGGFNRGTPGYL